MKIGENNSCGNWGNTGCRWGEEKRKRVTQIRRWEYILARDNLHKLQNMQTRKLGGRNIFSQEVGIYSHKRQHAQVAKYSYIARIYTHEFKVESPGENMFTNLLWGKFMFGSVGPRWVYVFKAHLARCNVYLSLRSSLLQRAWVCGDITFFETLSVNKHF